MKKRIAILGSTGSIGTSALAVADTHADRVEIVALAAGGNAAMFAAQVAQYKPRAIAMATGAAMDEVRAALAGCLPEWHGTGGDALVAVATHPAVDIVLCASSGTAATSAGRARRTEIADMSQPFDGSDEVREIQLETLRDEAIEKTGVDPRTRSAARQASKGVL